MCYSVLYCKHPIAPKTLRVFKRAKIAIIFGITKTYYPISHSSIPSSRSLQSGAVCAAGRPVFYVIRHILSFANLQK